MSSLSTDRLRAIAIACLVEPGTPGIAEMVAERGHEETLKQCTATTTAGRVAGRLHPHEVPGMLAEMSRLGVRVVLPGEAEFPSQLLDLPEPPLALWLRGPLDLRASALRSVAVVGARACTAYGERATGALAGGLADDGWTVVSGGAFGIDAAAHRAALGVGGPTMAVLACGVDIAYPRAHDLLLGRIADAGVVISELPPGSQPLRHRFLARNRLIAALSRGTVVVEAARRSGAVSTAARALEIGRVVMAVPGPITSMASAGTNRLLHEQSARAVSDSAEVVSLLVGAGAAGKAARSARGRGSGPDGSSGTGGELRTGEASGAGGQGRADEAPGTDGGRGRAGEPGRDGQRSTDRVRSTDGVGSTDGVLAMDGTPETDGGGGDPPVQLAGLPEEASWVLAALPSRGGRTVESVADRASLSAAACLALLGILEIAGLALRTRSGWRRNG